MIQPPSCVKFALRSCNYCTVIPISITLSYLTSLNYWKIQYSQSGSNIADIFYIENEPVFTIEQLICHKEVSFGQPILRNNK